MNHSVNERVEILLVQKMGFDVMDIVPNAYILDDLGADSLDILELVMGLEEMFDIKIPSKDVHTLRTISDIHLYVEMRIRSTVA